MDLVWLGLSWAEWPLRVFPICHGRATPSLISSAYNFTCGPIFLSFFILQDTHGFTSNVPPLALVLSLFVFLFLFFSFLERMWSCLFFWVFCVFLSQENLWVYGFVGEWLGYYVYGFIYGLVWFLDLFLVFLDFMETGFGCWIWIWDLLEISFGLCLGFGKKMKDRFLYSYEKIMKSNKKNLMKLDLRFFLKKFNLIFCLNFLTWLLKKI